MKFFLLLLLPFFLAFPAYATWVWNPETGWINSQYDSSESVSGMYQKAVQLHTEQKYADAASLFQNITEKAPNTPEGKKSIYFSAICYYACGEYESAYIMYEEYLRQNQNTEKLSEILLKEYEIGTILIRGKVESANILDFQISSSAEFGVEVLQKLISNAPYFHLADDAQLTIANYFFKEQEYKKAELNYQKILQEYPKSEWAGFAQYQVAVCLSEQFHGIPYDSGTLHSSQKETNVYLQKYKQDTYVEHAQKHLKKVREDLAQRELEVAKYYIRKDEIPAAKIYLLCLIQEYRDTDVSKQAENILRELPQK